MKSIRIFFLFFFLTILFRFATNAQTTGSFIFDGISRTYTLYIPSVWSAGDQLPLLLSLHGLTQTGNEMMLFTGFNNIAEENSFIVVYPDGVSNSWNVGFTGGSTADDVGFLSALIDTLHQRYSVDLSRIYATGFSNGGFMAYRLACELGNRIAAIASVSGTMTDGAYTSCQPQRKIPVMHVHGTSDYVVNYNGGLGNKSVDEVLTLWRGSNNCPDTATIIDLPDLVSEGSTVQKQTWSPCDDLTEVVLYKVINGGHTWPGSVGTTGIGITNQDINASVEIWNFVSRFFINMNTGLHEFRTNAVKMFPNPSTGTVNLQTEQIKKPAILEICNSTGIQVFSSTIPTGSTQIRFYTKSFPPGLYLVRLLFPACQYSGKLMVE